MIDAQAVRAIAGPHASLPPTLLAAQPFIRGQMQTLKVRYADDIGTIVLSISL